MTAQGCRAAAGPRARGVLSQATPALGAGVEAAKHVSAGSASGSSRGAACTRGGESMTAVTAYSTAEVTSMPNIASTGPPLDDGGDLATPPARVRG